VFRVVCSHTSSKCTKTVKNFKLECQFYLLSLIFYYFMLIFYFTLFEYIAKGHFLKKNAILQFSYMLPWQRIVIFEILFS
jgi:hypothetical protein